MLKLQVWLILGTIIIASDCRRRPSTSNQRRGVFNTPSTKIQRQSSPSTSSSSSSEERVPFTSWELSMLSQMLVDISVNRCKEVVQDLVKDFKIYVERVMDIAPSGEMVSKNFMELYDSLVQCFQLSLESSNREQQEKTIQISNLNENVIDITANTAQVVFRPDHDEIVTFVNESSANKHTETSLSTASSTQKSITPPAATQVPKKNKGKGILNNVGHLFTKLYDNTISIFSSIFGRKKRGSADDANYSSAEDQDEDEALGPISQRKKRFYANSRASYTKEVYNRDDLSGVEKNHPMSAYWKRTPKRTSLNNFRHNSFAKLSEKHFRTVFKSMSQVALRSCPIPMAPHMDVLRDALQEIFTHLKHDSELRADVAVSQRELFPLNFQLQRKVHSCSKEVGVVVL